MTSDRVEIGGVARSHGIRGEIVVVTHDPDSDTLDGIDEIFIGGVAHRIVAARDTPNKGWLVQLVGIDTRDAADKLRGAVVEVMREALNLEEGEVLLADLVGCACVTVGGVAWGTIVQVDSGPMQDLLVIEDGEIERMLPLVDAFVIEIDVAGRRVVIDPPEGLPESKVSKGAR